MNSCRQIVLELCIVTSAHYSNLDIDEGVLMINSAGGEKATAHYGGLQFRRQINIAGSSFAGLDRLASKRLDSQQIALGQAKVNVTISEFRYAYRNDRVW